MSHYDTLGVPRGASPSEIKAAFRKAASAAHPDREGGSDERMAEINRAYECLSDPERREHYDRTGQDKSLQSLDDQVQNCIRKAFAEAIQRDSEDPLEYVRNWCDDQRRDIEGTRTNLGTVRNTLARRRDRVQRKEGTNAYLLVLDDMIDKLDRQIAEGETALALHKAVEKELNHYRSTVVAKPKQTDRYVNPFRNATSNWGGL